MKSLTLRLNLVTSFQVKVMKVSRKGIFCLILQKSRQFFSPLFATEKSRIVF